MRALPALLATPLAATLAATLVACGDYDPEARLFRLAMTSIDDVAVEPPGADRQEILDETAPAGNQVQQAIEDPACRPGGGELRLPRCQARRISVVLNTMTFFLLSTVDRILQERPTHRFEARRVWGPLFVNGGSIRLDVSRNPDDTFSYCVHIAEGRVGLRDPDAREITCADAVDAATGMVRVLTGDVEPREGEGGAVRSGAGTLIFDADALASVNPEAEARGTFTIRYDNVTRVGERLIDISIDDVPLEQAPFQTGARYRFTLDEESAGTFQFTVRDNAEFLPNGTAALERFDITARWLGGLAGRADSRISGGDLGQNEAFQIQCWGEDLATTYYEDLSRSLGDPNSCVFDEPLAPIED